ncbi:MAG TPA: EVE domain-containing protein [Verrucomicrobiae bacterium]|nr:EVE domain-containing protein [Verrucomicrobiae bacterium]
MAMNYWLVKQEPEDYSWDTFFKEGWTVWTGVRNAQARNNLRAMKKDDLVLYYHSGKEKRVVGIAQVEREHYPDPSAKKGDWSAVEFVPFKILKKPVLLSKAKTDKLLKAMPLVKQSRLSVSPATPEQFQRILDLGDTTV